MPILERFAPYPNLWRISPLQKNAREFERHSPNPTTWDIRITVASERDTPNLNERVAMQFTSRRRLLLLQRAFERAKSDVRMEIGMCDNVHEHAEYIKELEEEIIDYEWFLDRVNAALEKRKNST